jgi:hypothetical protein
MERRACRICLPHTSLNFASLGGWPPMALEIKGEIAEPGIEVQSFPIHSLCEGDHRVKDLGVGESKRWVEVIVQGNLDRG